MDLGDIVLFVDAIRSVLTQYAGFSGRARRSEYWWFYLFITIVNIVFGCLSGVAEAAVFIGLIVSLALLLPTIAVSVRRLHDTNRSGWFMLLGLIPIVGGIILLIFFTQDSKPGPNRFGPNPKDPAASGLVA